MHIVYAILENIFQVAIDYYKAEVAGLNEAAEQGTALSPEEMDKLVKANARAKVAYFNQKKLNTDLTDHLPLVKAGLEHQRMVAIERETDESIIRFYDELLTAFDYM